MTVEELVKNYPRAYHMAEFGSWVSICQHGLRSTTALLDLFEITGERRVQLESQQRPDCVPITHPVHGTAVIRDQKVLSDSALAKCLTGASPRQWYELLNRKTFFWLHPNRLTRLLKGRAYRALKHCVITVDTQRLIDQHGDRIRFSPINSGSTIMNPASRSPSTFHTLSDFPFAARSRGRRLEDVVVELAVDYWVPNIERLAICVEHRQANSVLERIWRTEGPI